MALPPWVDRPPEVASLLNPAFCGLLCYAAIDGYQSIEAAGMPFSESFLVLPLLLHEPTRQTLPRQIRSPLMSWAAGNPAVRVGMSERIRESADLTREALMFMIAGEAIRISAGGVLLPGRLSPRMSVARNTTPNLDIRERVQQATLVGRLLARAGTPATVLATLGLTP
ncbi:MAG: hypothetical protein K2V38_00505 [Gemmataceae bacterium]|nr:hypothetical protein [Gemmataceae bacterium]